MVKKICDTFLKDYLFVVTVKEAEKCYGQEATPRAICTLQLAVMGSTWPQPAGGWRALYVTLTPVVMKKTSSSTARVR